jgi:hypothetical protein
MRVRRLVLVVLGLLASTFAIQAQRAPAWVVLGERSVTDRLDHDRIEVGAARGTFRAVRLDVSGHAVDFQKVVIHFHNGGDQNVGLKHTIAAGGSSRVIDVEGANRTITSIEFWYDAKTMGRGGRALVKAMGRR